MFVSDFSCQCQKGNDSGTRQHEHRTDGLCSAVDSGNEELFEHASTAAETLLVLCTSEVSNENIGILKVRSSCAVRISQSVTRTVCSRLLADAVVSRLNCRCVCGAWCS